MDLQGFIGHLKRSLGQISCIMSHLGLCYITCTAVTTVAKYDQYFSVKLLHTKETQVKPKMF